MKIIFSEQAWEDYLWWQSPGNEKVLERVNGLLKDILRSPFKGIGKPEPLKNQFSGWWSRRINNDDRIVYRVRGKGEDQTLELAQLRYHY